MIETEFIAFDSERSESSHEEVQKGPCFFDNAVKNLEKQEYPCWISKKRQYSSNMTIMLHEEIIDFARYIEPSQEEHRIRTFVVDTVHSLLLDHYPNCSIIPFGSFVTKLYLPQSDIDVTLWIKRTPVQREIAGIIRNIARILERSKQFVQVEPVLSAKVPIVKAIHKEFGICVDVSLQQTNGEKTVRTVRNFLTRYPALRPLVFVLKMFFVSRDLHEVFTGGISSFSVITMLVCFLSSHPLIVRGDILPEQNLGILLIEFFELFSRCFDHREVAVFCDGFTRKNISNDKLNRYYLSIIDPDNMSNDLAKGSKNTPYICKSLEFGFEMLTSVICHCMTKKHTPKTILGTIFTLDSIIINKRNALIDNWRDLQHLLESNKRKK